MPFRPGNLRAAFTAAFCVDLLAGHDAAGLRALLPQDARELARVDARDGDDLAALEEVARAIRSSASCSRAAAGRG